MSTSIVCLSGWVLSSISLLHFCNIVLLHLLYYLLRWNGVDEMAQTGCRNGTTNTTIENIRLWMYTLNGNVWYLLCLVWSSSTCFRLENISYKWLFHTSGKMTTTLGAIFKTLNPKWKKKHQIMNVHTKWNCLIPILFSLVKYFSFQAWKC